MGRDRTARPDAKPRRLFVAVEIPEPAKASVEEAFRPWRDAFPRARWVPRENWHVTLKFLGRTWPRLLAWVPDRLESAARTSRPFAIGLSGVGSFPSPRRGRVLWAGVTDPVGGLAALVSAVDEALQEEFPAESRPFHPHLTVARSEPPVQLPDEYGRTTLATDRWEVDHLVLFESHLRRPAPLYEPIARVGLAP